jgi:hypothetical protein
MEVSNEWGRSNGKENIEKEPIFWREECKK